MSPKCGLVSGRRRGVLDVDGWRLGLALCKDTGIPQRRMELGDQPLLLAVPDHGVTLDERDHLDRQAWEQLRDRGLVDTRRPRPEIEDALGALAYPALEAELRMITGPGQEIRVLACASGMVGVVSVPTTQAVDLVPAHPSRLAEALLAHVPDHPAAAGNRLTSEVTTLIRTVVEAAASQR